MKRYRSNSGFTLIETSAALIIVVLVSVGLVSVSRSLFDMEQQEDTKDRLNHLRRAIGGNPLIVVSEARTSFGFLGDMGKLPSSIEDLWVKGSQPAFAFNTARKVGAGWNGPYLEVNPAEFVATLSNDGWGNPLFYSDAAFIDPNLGAQVRARLASLGPDLALGTNDDVAIQFYQAAIFSRVQGFVKDTSNNPVSGVGITMNYPENGVLTTQDVFSDATGYYSASDVPFGNRSLTIEPKLVLAPGTTVVTGSSNQHLKFTVKNYAATAVSVTSITVNYEVAPEAYFGRIEIDGSTVFNSTNPRLGSGDSTSFSAKTATGTGLTAESIPIRVQSPVTDVADIVLGKVGAGGSLVIQLRDFYDQPSGGGGDDVDVIGVSFEVILKNNLNQVVGNVVVQP